MKLASQIAALDLPGSAPPGSGTRFVYVDGDEGFFACGNVEASRGGFDVIDDAFADGRFWCVRANFDGSVFAWRPSVVRRLYGRDVPALPTPPDRLDDDDGRAAYEGAVARALLAIDAGTLEKLVLARRRHFSLPAAPDFPRLVEALASHAGCVAFAIEHGAADRGEDRERVFCGASPERLLLRRGSTLEVDCVAGTRAANDAAGLLESAKDRREHQAVVDGVVEAIGGTADDTRVVVRGPLAHLAAVVRATAVGPPSSQLSRLHPTAATAGRPRERALAMLRDIEGFDRGAYSGFVGFCSDGVCSFAVALRCASVDVDHNVCVTVGAGVVAGSSPAAEWRETQQKAQVLWPALMHAVVAS